MTKTKGVYGEYFYGNKISDYGLEHNRVDYATLAKAFDTVLNNTIYAKGFDIGYGWEMENGSFIYYEDSEDRYYSENKRDERIEELDAEHEELEIELENTNDEKRIEEIENRVAEIKQDLEWLEDEHYIEFYQYYIISTNGAEILSEFTDEVVFYHEELDMYLWAVSHFGTSWDYVLTDIVILRGFEQL